VSKEAREDFNRKMAVFEQVKGEVEAYVNAGGDLKSAEAGPLSVRFLKATNDMMVAAGCEPFIVPIKK
jgi:hypothetical protein